MVPMEPALLCPKRKGREGRTRRRLVAEPTQRVGHDPLIVWWWRTTLSRKLYGRGIARLAKGHGKRSP
jgi:hypothetical protein